MQCLTIFMSLLPLSVLGRSHINTLKGVCDRTWEVIYAHEADGNATFGDKKELVDFAMKGHYVTAHLYMPDHILRLSSDNMNRRGDDICFQSLRALSHNGTHIDTEDPWLFYMVCSSGQVTERSISNTSYFRVAMDWYIKDINADSKPVYTNYIDGSPVKPMAFLQLEEVAKHMALYGVMRDKPYVFPFHNVIMDTETGEINGQNVIHMGQKYIDNYVSFHDVPYKWYSHWSNMGHRDNARWSLQKHTAYKHNNDSASLDWHADICWRHVYTNDESGFELMGTKEELIAYIERGHRVRVRIEDISMEASNIRVRNGEVAAQLLHEVSRVGGYGPDKYFIEADTRAKFTIAHTTGRVSSMEYLVGAPVSKVSSPLRKTIEWMVDTRPWRVVLKTEDPPARVVQGSPFDLGDAIRAGASIRFNVVLDPFEGSFFTQANNLRVDLYSDTVYAQAMDHMSDKKAGLKEYDFQDDIFAWYLLISSDGPVRMTAFMYGSDTFKYDEGAPEANVTWFANM